MQLNEIASFVHIVALLAVPIALARDACVQPTAFRATLVVLIALSAPHALAQDVTDDARLALVDRLLNRQRSDLQVQRPPSHRQQLADAQARRRDHFDHRLVRLVDFVQELREVVAGNDRRRLTFGLLRELRDAAIYTESDHLPAWAEDNAREYWDAADLYERANGRLYISADFALPRSLDAEDQVELAHAFAQELTTDERLPYTLAIHAGKAADGQDHNPHAHIMISERQNDGIPRSREQWFRRPNREHPGLGGASKSRTFHGREWME